MAPLLLSNPFPFTPLSSLSFEGFLFLNVELAQDGNYLYLVMEYLPGGDVMVISSYQPCMDTWEAMAEMKTCVRLTVLGDCRRC